MPSQPTRLTLGPSKAEVIFYLPTPPLLPPHWYHNHPNAITDIIALNGNHWRKIVTIMAKICCRHSDLSANNGAAWKPIRQSLLQDVSSQSLAHRLSCQIQIIPSQLSHATEPLFNPKCWHIVCGKETQQRLGLHTIEHTQTVDVNNKIQRQQTCLLTPYLDYRQYANALIETTRLLIASEDLPQD